MTGMVAGVFVCARVLDISTLLYFGMLSRVFFFFKQKTAYEMRISDWSSDVCSSDLLEEKMHPREHVANVRGQLKELQDHLRDDIERCDEPQLRAMFETSAEVLGGLAKAFSDYERKNETAWQSQRETDHG